jgi:iron complex outermembrane receptor protein
LSNEEIERKNIGKDIPFLLERTPSAVATSDAGHGIGYTGIRIRGTDATRINVTLNGIPLNDAESQAVFWVNVPDLASSVDNIQIQRGVGTSTNGSATFGASINIQSSRLKPDPYAIVSSSAGSFRTFKNTINFGTGLIKGRWTVDGRLSKITSDGYIDRAFSDLKSLYASAAYYGEKTILRFNILTGREKTYQAWAGVPQDSLETNRTYNPFTYPNQTDNYQQDHYQLLFAQQLRKDLVFNAALHYTYGRGYYEEYQDLEDPYAATSFAYYGLDEVIIGIDTIRNTNLIRQKWLDNDFYGLTFSLDYDHSNLHVILGGSYNIYRGRAWGNIIWAEFASNSDPYYKWYNSNSVKQDFNIYGKVSYQVNDLLGFFADLQYRFIDWKLEGTEDAYGDISQSHLFSFINPKAGINYHINQRNESYFSFAVANREPSRQNYIDASDDPVKPTSETLYDFELGYAYKAPKTALMVNAFYMKYVDQLVATGELDNVGYAILRNVPDSYRLGMELSFGLKILDNLSWTIYGTVSSNKIKDFEEYVDDFDTGGKRTNLYNSTDISFSPGLTAGSDLIYKPFDGFDVSLVSSYVSRQYIDNTNSLERSIDPYFVNNLRFNYEISMNIIDRLALHFEIINLFNEIYESNAWTYRYILGGEYQYSSAYFPQAGIHFMGGITLNF